MSQPSGAQQSFYDDHLGLTVTEGSGDRVVGVVDVDDRHRQPYGIVHGGVYCSMVETVGSVAGALWFGDRGHVVGVNNNTHFLRAVREGRLTAVATPVHRGRTQQLWQVDVTDAADRLVARGELRVANLASADVIGH